MNYKGMDYEEILRHPGDNISSGSEMLEVLGYTDTRNPIYTFDLMNDSKFKDIENFVKKDKEIPERYNNNVIRLRDYTLGTILNDLIDLCENALDIYKESWHYYREIYNPKMPEDISEFYYIPDSIIFEKVLPKYINLIDPLTMKWLDPEGEKISVQNGIYQYQLDTPIKTSDSRFLYPQAKLPPQQVEDFFLSDLLCEMEQETEKYIPHAITKVDYLLNSLDYDPEIPGETQENRIQRIKNETRIRYRRIYNA